MAKRAFCANNLRQFSVSHNLYADDFEGWFPIAVRTSAARFWLDTGSASDFESYYDPNVFICPTHKYLGTIAQYGPGYRWNGGINGTYRIYAARGDWDTADFPFIFWGFYALGGKPTTPDSIYCVACPNRKFLGRLVADPVGTATPDCYMHVPSEQPMAMDGRHGVNDKWVIYAASSFSTNHHRELNGINVIFFDGHVQWGNQKSAPNRMYVGYWDGYMKW